MGKTKKAPKFAVVKKLVSSKTLRKYKEVLNPKRKDLETEKLPRNVPSVPSALFFKHNTALGPPYRVLVATNFINFSIQNSMCDCSDKDEVHVTFGFGERNDGLLVRKMHPLYHRLCHGRTGKIRSEVPCSFEHKCYIVATFGRDLKRRIRKIPGVPIINISIQLSACLKRQSAELPRF